MNLWGAALDVDRFHRVFGCPRDGWLTAEEIEQRHAFLLEEAKELKKAVDKGNPIETLDGGLDVIFVALGTMIAAGLSPHQIARGWSRVVSSNMSKTAPEERGGKVVKGPDFFPPDFGDIV